MRSFATICPVEISDAMGKAYESCPRLRFSSRAPYSSDVPSLMMNSVAASVRRNTDGQRLRALALDLQTLPRHGDSQIRQCKSSISIFKIFSSDSRDRLRNTMIRSIRFMNSGRNNFCAADLDALYSSVSKSSPGLGLRRVALQTTPALNNLAHLGGNQGCWMSEIDDGVLERVTCSPLASVRRPSPSTVMMASNSRACPFSIFIKQHDVNLYFVGLVLVNDFLRQPRRVVVAHVSRRRTEQFGAFVRLLSTRCNQCA